MVEKLFKRTVASFLKLLFRSHPPETLGTSPHRILVIRQHNQLGDMLCVVPLLRALRAKYPEARLDLMASPVNQEVMLKSRLLSGVVLYDKKKFLRNGLIRPVTLLRFIGSLRGLYQMVLVPGTVSTSFTSDFLAFLTGARLRIGVGSLEGHENNSSFFFNIAEDLQWGNDPHRHQTLRNLDVARSLNLETPDCSHQMTLTEDEIEIGRTIATGLRSSRQTLIGFHPGAGKTANRWPPEMFAELIDLLTADPAVSVFVTSGPMDEQVVASTTSKLKSAVQIVSNQGVRTIASIIKQADLYVTNDTGVMHIAAAVGAPVLALFGPTDPLQWAPLGPKIRYIQGEGGDIRQISVDAVYRAATGMIGKKRP